MTILSVVIESERSERGINKTQIQLEFQLNDEKIVFFLYSGISH